MKRVFLLMLILPLLCSCSKERDIPLIERYPITVTGELSHNGSCYAVSITLKGPGCGTVAIDAPENLSGYSFKVDNSSIWVYYDNVEAPLSAGVTDYPFLNIIKAMSVSRPDFEYSRREKDAVIYHYMADDADIAVYTTLSDTAPTRIEYVKESVCVRLDITNIVYN